MHIAFVSQNFGEAPFCFLPAYPKAGLSFLPFIREGRNQQKNPNDPVNPVEKTNFLSGRI